MPDLDLSDALRDETRTAWHRYLDQLNPIRPDLYRYCRRLTATAWDAEDLVQDVLIRGFAQLGITHSNIENPRAYLLRIATNLWIDIQRRRGTERNALEDRAEDLAPSATEASPDQAPLVRSAGATLMKTLSPQEQASILLKDVFDLSLEETAGILSTSVGAVKSALHHGRGRLRELRAGAAPRGDAPPAELVDAFAKRLAEKDLSGLLDLMLETGSIQTGYLVENGRNELERPGSWLWSACHGHPNRPKALQGFVLEQRVVTYGDEPILLQLSERDGQWGLTSVLRFEIEDGRIARLINYAGPEFIRELSEDLGLPCHTFGLYRPPTPGPGKEWPAPQERPKQS